MEKYLTNFYTESAYNSFLDSAECPPVNVSYIIDTDEVKYYDATTEAIKEPFEIIMDSYAYRSEYKRWIDTPNRWLAEGAMSWGQWRAGEYWYNLGANYKLYINTASDGLVCIDGTEWQYDENGWAGGAYYSSTTINGYPVCGFYHIDSDSPDFYVYNSDNGNVTYMYVEYEDTNREIVNTYLRWNSIVSGEYNITVKYREVDRTGSTPVYGEWQTANSTLSSYNVTLEFPFSLQVGHGVQIVTKSSGIYDIYPNYFVNLKFRGNYMSVIWGDRFPYATLNTVPYATDNGRILHGDILFLSASDASEMLIPCDGAKYTNGAGYYSGAFRSTYRKYKAPIFFGNYLSPRFLFEAYAGDEWGPTGNTTTIAKLAVNSVSRSNTLNSMYKNNAYITNIDPTTGNTPEIDWLDIKEYVYDANEAGGFSSCFSGCINLRYAPPMHLEKIGHYDWAFYEAFNNCTHLIECDWTLPITNDFTDVTFGKMFYNCSNLTSGPTLTGECTEYKNFGDMFYGCTSLAELKFPGMIGPFEFTDSQFAQTGTVYVNDNSVYLDSTSEYYGQSPISGWTVEAWSNYPTN